MNLDGSILYMKLTICYLHETRVFQPEDYEPPFFRKSSYSESNKWTKDPLNMDVGNINSKHHALSLKVSGFRLKVFKYVSVYRYIY